MTKFSKTLKINKPWGGEKIVFRKNSSSIKGILKIITIKKVRLAAYSIIIRKLKKYMYHKWKCLSLLF